MLELRNISFAFDGRTIIDDVNLSFQRGNTYVITGISGSGKSLLMKILGGIIKPTDGAVLLHGVNLYVKTKGQYPKRKIGFVFENGVFLSNLSIIDNLLLPVTHLCPQLKRNEVLETIKKLFDEFKISHKNLYKRPSDVSSTNKKMIDFIRAMLIDPEYYLINMPLFNLSFGDIDKVTTYLRKIKLEGKGIIITTTSRTLIDRFADYVTVIEEGRASFSGTMEQFYRTDEQNVKDYIQMNIGW